MSARLLSAVLGAGLVLGSITAGPVAAAEGKASGLMFGDYYYQVAGANKKQNGFQFRRIYYTYDLKWNDDFSGRFRLEANDAGYGKTDKMIPYVKNAYLQYKREGRSLQAGLVGTPTFSISESVWGYRSVEKTIMDLRKIRPSSDLGVLAMGKLDEAGKVNLQLMVGNGTGQSPEVDMQKTVYALVDVKPGSDVEATAYADWQKQPQSKDQMTLAVFAAENRKDFRGGVEGFLRTNKKSADGSDVKVEGVSLFGAGKLNESWSAFGRLDYYEPSDKTKNDKQYLIIAGADLTATKDVHVIPNVEITSYEDSNKDTEVLPRVTAYFTF